MSPRLLDPAAWPTAAGGFNPWPLFIAAQAQPRAIRTLAPVHGLALRSSDHFYLFTAWASFSAEAQQRLQAVGSPQEIVALAAERGYAITVEQLHHFARRLQEPHWVWNQHDEAWARDFFQGASLPPPGAWVLRA